MPYVRLLNYKITMFPKPSGAVTDGMGGAHFSFHIKAEAELDGDPEFSTADIQFSQDVSTQIKIKEVGQALNTIETPWHDDGYGDKDLKWEVGGREFSVTDNPGLDVRPNQKIQYCFTFQHAIYSRGNGERLLITPRFQLKMDGSTKEMTMSGQYIYCWKYPDQVNEDVSGTKIVQ